MPYGAINLKDVAVQPLPVHEVDGIEAREGTTAEYLEAMNGRLKLDVRNVRGERVIPMNGSVPEEWRLV